MAKVVVMPKLGYTQDEGTIAEWHKQVGDPVAIGDPFFDVHTDKSVITVEASCAGTLLKIALEPGNTVPVLTPVAVVGEPGEDADAILASHVTAVVADARWRPTLMTMRMMSLPRRPPPPQRWES